MQKKYWFYIMLVTVAVSSLIVFQNTCFAQEDGDNIVTVDGKYRKIHSKINDKDVVFFEHLPDGYNESKKRYPVIYLINSGKQSLPFLNEGIFPEMITIGISDIDRPGDFFPVYPRSTDPGKADVLLKFITEELIPYVDQNYRTENYRILNGCSNAGLFTIYAMLSKPEAFNAYISSSPMLGWCPDLINGMAKTLFAKEKLLKNFIYIPYGVFDIKEYVNNHIPDFVKTLELHAPKSLRWKVKLYENGGHCPFTGLHDGLVELFPDYMITDDLKAQGLEAVEKHYQKLTEKYGFHVDPKKADIFDMAMDFKYAKKLDESIAVFKFLMERYPCYELEYYWLGEVYREKGDMDAAKSSFEKVLEINPDHKGAKEKLEMLNT